MGIICQRIMLLAFLFLIQANFLALAQPICIDNGNYTGNNSTYRANLNTVLSTLSTNLNSNGFTNASVGQSPDRANAIILCRGDLQLDECRSCLQDAVDKLLKGCPDQKQAIMWETQGNCMLRYSNETFIGSPLNTPSLSLLYTNSANVSSPEEFKEVLRRVIDILRGQAANGGPLRKVAAANVSGPDSMFIYSFVQCTPDLSKEDCSGCLITAAGEIPSCCGGKRGAALLFPSCILRFEQAFTFYNDTRLQELATSSPLLLPSPGKADGNTSKTSIIIVVSIVGPLIILAVVVVTLLMRKRIKRRSRKEELIESEAVDDISTIESLQYALSTIKLATNDFSDDNKLGQGGFGPVYKGRLSSGLEIAVKRLSVNSGQGILEFKNEVLLLSRLQHRNLVKLLGFCLEETEKLLVYEFVPNASLDFFIFDRNRSNLDWEKGYNIIRGIVRGILYLHEDSQLRIIHRDLKASNVLLDGDMNPKIADFGIARLFGQDETQGRGNTKRIVGTYGYMAPEYAARGHFSIKSDVFSFGVIVLEIISGRKNYSPQNGQHLLSFAWKNWHEGTPTNIVDPLLISGSGSMNDILRCIHIGLLCVQVNAADRPTMASVVLMLSSFTVTLAVPSKPAFYIYDSHVAEIREYNSRDIENNSSPISCHSSNDASITDLYPR